jgi:hypothetical protein
VSYAGNGEGEHSDDGGVILPAREGSTRRQAAAVGRSTVFKAGARHGMATRLWRARGARWPRASDWRALGG